MAAAVAGWEAARAKLGRAGAATYARKNLLAGQTLELLADMRAQFAGMLGDARFVAAPRGGRGNLRSGAAWVDDPAAAWNRHAAQPTVVRRRERLKGLDASMMR